MFTSDPLAHWEELARTNPYFAVLTQPRFEAGRIDERQRAEFYESGVRHFDRVRSLIPDAPLRSALDFGCGAGRVTYAMAKYAGRVIGVDAAPTMLQIAAANIAGPQAAGIQWLELAAFLRSPGKFDLVHSFLVFQHIPVSTGLKLLEVLAGAVDQNGHLVVQFAYWRRGGISRRIARALRSTLPGVNALANLLTGKSMATPYMQMNVYDVGAVLDVIFRCGLEVRSVVPENERDVRGVLLTAHRNSQSTA